MEKSGEKTEGSVARHGTMYRYVKHNCRCLECKGALHRQNSRRQKKKHRLPLEPLILNIPGFAESHKAGIPRWVNAGGITVYEADRLCTKYHIHPVSIFGSDWYSDYWFSENSISADESFVSE